MHLGPAPSDRGPHGASGTVPRWAWVAESPRGTEAKTGKRLGAKGQVRNTGARLTAYGPRRNLHRTHTSPTQKTASAYHERAQRKKQLSASYQQATSTILSHPVSFANFFSKFGYAAKCEIRRNFREIWGQVRDMGAHTSRRIGVRLFAHDASCDGVAARPCRRPQQMQDRLGGQSLHP